MFLQSFWNFAIEYRLHEKVTILSFSAHGFFIFTPWRMVTDLHDATFDKRQPKLLVDPPECSSKFSSWKIQKNSSNRKLDILPQFSEINEVSSSFLIDKIQFKITEAMNKNILPSTHLHNTKVSTANSSVDGNHRTSSLKTQFSDPTPQIFV